MMLLSKKMQSKPSTNLYLLPKQRSRQSHISSQTQTPVWNSVAARLNITPKISRVACGRRPSDSWNKTIVFDTQVHYAYKGVKPIHHFQYPVFNFKRNKPFAVETSRYRCTWIRLLLKKDEVQGKGMAAKMASGIGGFALRADDDFLLKRGLGWPSPITLFFDCRTNNAFLLSGEEVRKHKFFPQAQCQPQWGFIHV